MSVEANGDGAGPTILIELDPHADTLDALMTSLGELVRALAGHSKHFAAYQDLVTGRVTAYLAAGRQVPAVPDIKGLLDELMEPLMLGPVSVSLLSPRLAVAGASAGQPAPFRYVVHTDVEAGGAGELERWYDTEHMPGLAAVPGTVFAQRMICFEGSPPYFACYDLTAADVLDSDPWLAVRATEWSSRVRPTFRNTRRFMSRRLDYRGS
ncbi:hypothetical protein [Sphingobium lignivorans]|uniref:EthD domain-containing protein n=1 Tax=Sphingobium lignivorans TaxID=2735886 RepID=A0ABR6NIM5_9SPHN|nr:hypothetical protein [Sphingobium lignivorans]MBB5987121.1 hypothetical protein [Sphingobium lignivorans]